MRLATLRTSGGQTRAARIDDDDAVLLDAADVGAWLARPNWAADAAGATGERLGATQWDFAPLVPRPEKTICVGLNYRDHIEEQGVPAPEYPTLFAKYAPALIGARDDVILPRASTRVDWEVELAIIIGRAVRHADDAQAAAAIAGYTVCNDVSARDWQRRTPQFLQGKTFESTTPLGPWLVSADEFGGPDPHLSVTCEVDGQVMQQGNTKELVFGPIALVRYISTIITLTPGDVISTGTPGGVGDARKPPVYLQDGQVLTTRIEGIGECRNLCRRES